MQSRWPGISKQGAKGPEQCRESFHGESVTPGSPEITGACKAAPGRWEANVTYKVLEYDRCAESHCPEQHNLRDTGFWPAWEGEEPHGVQLVLGAMAKRQRSLGFGKRALMLEMDIGDGKVGCQEGK